jgi:rhodanese-related sulfurtransferase
MKKLLFFLLLAFGAWEVGWMLGGVKPLFPWQLQEEYRQGHPDLILLDVRTRTEFRWFHLPGALNVPAQELSAPELHIPKGKTVVVICMTGHRSPLVARRLQQVGYQEVYHLCGGMAGWQLYQWLCGQELKRPAPKVAPAIEQAGRISAGQGFSVS